jgi:streptogramin lyase
VTSASASATLISGGVGAFDDPPRPDGCRGGDVDNRQPGSRQNGDADLCRVGGAGPQDAYPAPDGTVWFTAQSAGKLGRLDPRTGSRI